MCLSSFHAGPVEVTVKQSCMNTLSRSPDGCFSHDSERQFNFETSCRKSELPRCVLLFFETNHNLECPVRNEASLLQRLLTLLAFKPHARDPTWLFIINARAFQQFNMRGGCFCASYLEGESVLAGAEPHVLHLGAVDHHLSHISAGHKHWSAETRRRLTK